MGFPVCCVKILVNFVLNFSASQESFFNWFYFAINLGKFTVFARVVARDRRLRHVLFLVRAHVLRNTLFFCIPACTFLSGALLSFTVVAYLCQNVSFALGYIIPSVFMFLGILTFISGRNRSSVFATTSIMLKLQSGASFAVCALLRVIIR